MECHDIQCVVVCQLPTVHIMCVVVRSPQAQAELQAAEGAQMQAQAGAQQQLSAAEQALGAERAQLAEARQQLAGKQ
jgi:hypothetical protein